jgi:Cys-tRNA(Pro)/Cys-tRNA(Cys) deacylase
LVLVAAGRALDLKRLAAALGEKKVSMATQAEAERLTGLQTGGISPLALLNRGFDIVLSAEAERLDYLHLSAGQRGANLRLNPQDLIALTRARLVAIEP